MLQIISGKFFKNEDRFCHDGKGILYSNFSWVLPIKTCVATIEPLDSFVAVPSYVISYKNQIEKVLPPKKDVIVRAGDSEIIDQFRLLCSFALKAFFHQEKNFVALACRDEKITESDYHIPSKFVPRIFSQQIQGNIKDTERLTSFIDEVIGLKREDYETLIIALRNYNDALQIIGINIDLAYSLLIYSLEALAQHSDGYKPCWEDYPNEIREELDKTLYKIPEKYAKNIRETLLKKSHLKARSRFLSFIITHINDQFFIDEAPQGNHAIRKTELERALINAYSLRSKFVHQLQPIKVQLKLPQLAKGDLIRYGGEPYLSISGLVRVVQHVINNFVKNRNKLVQETIDWRRKLPGTIMMELAPQYWIGKYKNIKNEDITKKLSGFFSQFIQVILNSGEIADLRELLKEYERRIEKSKEPYKTQMLVTYALFNTSIEAKGRNTNCSEILEKYHKQLNHCKIETMVLRLLVRKELPWEAKDCSFVWEEHQKKQHRKTSINIPPVIGVALITEIASKFKKEKDDTKYQSWMEMAILEAAGRKEIQNRLKEAISNQNSMIGTEIFDIETQKDENK